VADRAAGYNISGVVVPNDFLKIYEEAGKAIDRARKGKGPTLLEVKSTRWYGHYVGDAQKYRSERDIEAAKKEDCIKNFEDKLIEDKILQKQNVERIEEKIHEEIENAINFARESPFPDDSELMEGLYA